MNEWMTYEISCNGEMILPDQEEIKAWSPLAKGMSCFIGFSRGPTKTAVSESPVNGVNYITHVVVF